MKIRVGLSFALALAVLPLIFSSSVKAGNRLYLHTCLKAEEASRLQAAGRLLDARVLFDECLFYMEYKHRLSPDWEASLVESKIIEYRNKVADLKMPATREAMSPQARDAATSLFEDGCVKSAKEGPQSALRDFETSLMIMTLDREHDPDWHSEPMSKIFESCQSKLASIRAQILAEGAGDSTL